LKWVFVDTVRRFSLEIDEDSGRTFVAIPVEHQDYKVEYTEWYEVDPETFARYRGDPTLAHEFVERCKRGELDADVPGSG
jgi:hypothetical protein